MSFKTSNIKRVFLARTCRLINLRLPMRLSFVPQKGRLIKIILKLMDWLLRDDSHQQKSNLDKSNTQTQNFAQMGLTRAK